MTNVATLDRTEVRIVAPELRGAALALGRCRDFEVCLDGPAGTGKTVGALFKIHMLLTKYPGARWLLARKYSTDLAGAAVQTYRNMLDPREGVRHFGGSKFEPAAFRYPNGSSLIVAGLDKPEKVKSKDYDGAFINEATECSEEDAEFVLSRLRYGVCPYPQLVMDVNPGPPSHWLNQRMNAGKTTRLLSRHQDNPRYFDAATKDWTEEGHRYIFGILEKLTGVRYARLRLGLWAAAEGTVYEDTWDRARNVIARFAIPKEWPRYLAIDFGFTKPFACLWAAQDPDGRLFVYRQIYQTKTLVEDHARQIKAVSRWGEAGGEPLPRAIICDHDAEDRATLERHLGLATIPAHKAVSSGLQAVASRLKAAGDGKARVAVLGGGLVELDRDLAAAKKPTCLEDEPESYVWDTSGGAARGEQPKKENDHAMDALRYLVAYFDLAQHDVTYHRSVWR